MEREQELAPAASELHRRRLALPVLPRRGDDGTGDGAAMVAVEEPPSAR